MANGGWMHSEENLLAIGLTRTNRGSQVLRVLPNSSVIRRRHAAIGTNESHIHRVARWATPGLIAASLSCSPATLFFTTDLNDHHRRRNAERATASTTCSAGKSGDRSGQGCGGATRSGRRAAT